MTKLDRLTQLLADIVADADQTENPISARYVLVDLELIEKARNEIQNGD